MSLRYFLLYSSKEKKHRKKRGDEESLSYLAHPTHPPPPLLFQSKVSVSRINYGVQSGELISRSLTLRSARRPSPVSLPVSPFGSAGSSHTSAHFNEKPRSNNYISNPGGEGGNLFAGGFPFFSLLLLCH